MVVLLKFPKNLSLTGTSCGMTNWLSNADIRSIYCCGVHVLSLGGFSTLLHWLHRNEGVKMREKQSNWTKSGWSVFLCRVWGVVQWPCVQTTYHNVSLPRTLYCGWSRIYNERLRLVGSSGSSMDHRWIVIKKNYTFITGWKKKHWTREIECCCVSLYGWGEHSWKHLFCCIGWQVEEDWWEWISVEYNVPGAGTCIHRHAFRELIGWINAHCNWRHNLPGNILSRRTFICGDQGW